MNDIAVVRRVTVIDVEVVRTCRGVEDFYCGNFCTFINAETFCWHSDSPSVAAASDACDVLAVIVVERVAFI